MEKHSHLPALLMDSPRQEPMGDSAFWSIVQPFLYKWAILQLGDDFHTSKS